MSTAQTLKVSPSTMERAGQVRPGFEKYAAKLKEMDKNADGELDMDEICDFIDKTVESEKQNRMLKRIAMALAIFSLLIIAAVVGLTYAVVALSKEVKVSPNNTLLSNGNGEAVRTSSNLVTKNLTSLGDLVASTSGSSDAQSLLARLTSITIPGNEVDGEDFVVHQVASVASVNNGTGVRVGSL